MRPGRRALLGWAMLAVPGTALAEEPRKPLAKPAPPGQKHATGRTAAPPAGQKPPAKGAGKPSAARARAKPAPAVRSEPAAEAEPRPRGPARLQDDRPALRPVDRELVRNWLAANPEWRPPGQPLAVPEGRPLPPGLARQALPPGLAMLLPYFPGYRYAACGPDLVLFAAGSEVVTSILPGALAR